MLTGILGGTFDPVHLGHLHIASQVLARLALRGVQFMPCALPVHRGSPHASAAHRCAMIELAIRGNPAFSLNRVELQHDGPSYTVDSLYRIRRDAAVPDDDGLALILGADAFGGFGAWKEPLAILELANLVVCRRPGYVMDDSLFADRRVASPAELQARRAGAILVLSVDAPDCSSSGIRDALRRNDGARHCLNNAVADYIEQHNLYRNTSD